MITVDLVSPGGLFTAAPANTQELTTTFTITSGAATTLICDGATPFVPGDTGKYFMANGIGSQAPTATWLYGTMTYVNSNTVTLSTPATKFLATQSMYLTWGNDDGPAFRAFHDWAVLQSDDITLTLGTGAKTFMPSSSDPTGTRAGSPVFGLQGVTIKGNGIANTRIILSPVNRSFSLGSTFYIKSGSGAWPHGGTKDFTARLDSITAGSTTAQCKVIADSNDFTAGTWTLLSGLDLMGVGQPPNPFVFEYIKISNVNTTTGQITFDTPVQYDYSDTWPAFTPANIGLEPDQGGPPTLYAMDPGWDIDAAYEDFELVNVWGQSHTKARRLVFRNFRTANYGLIPTGGKEVEFYNCDLPSQMEIDKIAEDVLIDNCTTGQLLAQSSINRLTLQNGSVTSALNGTVRFMEMHDSTITTGAGFGAIAFGRSDSFITSGSTFNTSSYLGVTDNGDNGSTPLLGSYTMSSTGVLTMPRAGRDYPGLRWAVPGTRVKINGRELTGGLYIVSWGPMFTVLDVTADSTNIYVQTDWPYGALQGWVSSFSIVPFNYCSFASDTTTSDEAIQTLMAANALGMHTAGTYKFKHYNGSNCGQNAGSTTTVAVPITGGRLISMTVNVTTPYTGALNSGNPSILLWSRSNPRVIMNGSTFTDWPLTINLKQAGLRTITPTGVTGAQSGDTISAPPTNAWLSNVLGGWGTGERDLRPGYITDPSLGPEFDLELFLDQSPEVLGTRAPLRLRVHG